MQTEVRPCEAKVGTEEMLGSVEKAVESSEIEGSERNGRNK